MSTVNGRVRVIVIHTPPYASESADEIDIRHLIDEAPPLVRL